MSESAAFDMRDRGIELVRKGQSREAVTTFRQALELWRNLAWAAPSNTNAQRNLAIGANDLAGALHAVGDFSEALDRYEEALHITDKLLDSDGHNEELIRDQAITFGKIAMTSMSLRHWDEATETSDGAVALFSKLVENTPRDLRRKFDLAVALQRRAIVRGTFGAAMSTSVGTTVRMMVPQALGDAEASCRMLREILRNDSSNVAWKQALEASERVYTAALRPPAGAPELSLKALLQFGDSTEEGLLVQAVGVPWFTLLEIIRRDPHEVYQIDARRWEEIVAGAYTRAGFDEVILTPRSGDKGRDVVATKRGIGCIRIFDQVKAYKPGHVVTAEEVRAMLGVITGAQNVSKGVLTTTSQFAPRLMNDDFIRPFIPYRLELKALDALLSWLTHLSSSRPRGEDNLL